MLLELLVRMEALVNSSVSLRTLLVGALTVWTPVEDKRENQHLVATGWGILHLLTVIVRVGFEFCMYFFHAFGS